MTAGNLRIPTATVHRSLQDVNGAVRFLTQNPGNFGEGIEILWVGNLTEFSKIDEPSIDTPVVSSRQYPTGNCRRGLHPCVRRGTTADHLEFHEL